MPAFLVTGNPGSGKSTVGKELSLRGLATIDEGVDQQLAFWADAEGNRMPLADEPSSPDHDLFQTHRWMWDRSRLEELVAQHDRPVFVCGIAVNLEEVLDLFDTVFLLQIDEATQETRLAAFDQLNPPGRSKAAKQVIREWREAFEAKMLSLGAIALDGTASTPEVADKLLSYVALD